MSDTVSKDADISIYTLDSDEGLEIMRHTVAAQVLARAIKNLYPKAKLAIGPTIENGFYYDFLSDERVSIDDLPKIEKEMKKIVAEKSNISKTIHSKKEAIKMFADISEDYKVKSSKTLNKKIIFNFIVRAILVLLICVEALIYQA